MEAVIVIPVLIILAVGILWMRDLATTRQQARAHARSCAWRYALPGCVEVPKGCDAPERAGARGNFEGLLDGLSDIPLIGSAIDGLLGKAANFEVKREAKRSTYTSTVRGSMALVCNAKATTPGEVVKRLFCDAVPLCS